LAGKGKAIMNAVALYFLLLKATVTTFSGLASLPMLRDELVIHRALLTDQQLNTAVVVTRTTPGPVGVYVVSVGYFVAGVPGAVAGWLAMCTPALLILPLLRFAGRYAGHPRAKAIVKAVVFSSSGLLLASTLPMAAAAITDPATVVILIASLGLLLIRQVESVWVILAAAICYLSVAALRIVPAL
jgi:chromate transporter